MPQAVPIALASWIPVSLFLFWKWPARRATIFCLLGGWLLLPTARYDDVAAFSEFPYWILPASLPSPPWLTKAAVIPLATLLGMLLFDRGCFRRFRPSLLDLPMLGWIAWPIVSSLANAIGPRETLLTVSYQAVAWGFPYAIGRLQFADEAGRDEFARGIVAAGLLYAPLCLLENVIGPRLYAGLYGFHPYRLQGADRYVGFRPVVFLEDGNQLGIWLATSAAASAVMWRLGRLPRFWGMPGGLVAGGLVALAILSQSAGAILLLVLGLAAVEIVLRSGKLWPLLMPLALVAVVLALRAVNLVDAKAVAQKTSAGRGVITSLERFGRHSFGWRLRVEERQARVALQRPWTGWGRWDWWRSGEERPWGLPGLTLGMYGLPGWALLMLCLGVPVAKFLAVARSPLWSTPVMASATAMAAVLTLNGLDGILNGAYLMPLVAASGGLVGLSPSPGRADSPMGHLVVKIGR